MDLKQPGCFFIAQVLFLGNRCRQVLQHLEVASLVSSQDNMQLKYKHNVNPKTEGWTRL